MLYYAIPNIPASSAAPLTGLEQCLPRPPLITKWRALSLIKVLRSGIAPRNSLWAHSRIEFCRWTDLPCRRGFAFDSRDGGWGLSGTTPWRTLLRYNCNRETLGILGNEFKVQRKIMNESVSVYFEKSKVWIFINDKNLKYSFGESYSTLR